MRTVYVYECHRPTYENDQLLLLISNIGYVTKEHNSFMEKIVYYVDGNTYKLVIAGINVGDIPAFVNDFIFHNNIPQPCNISLYVARVTNVKILPETIRGLLENNLVKKG